MRTVLAALRLNPANFRVAGFQWQVLADNKKRKGSLDSESL
jgi:hypothetical protein